MILCELRNIQLMVAIARVAHETSTNTKKNMNFISKYANRESLRIKIVFFFFPFYAREDNKRRTPTMSKEIIVRFIVFNLNLIIVSTFK